MSKVTCLQCNTWLESDDPEKLVAWNDAHVCGVTKTVDIPFDAPHTCRGSEPRCHCEHAVDYKLRLERDGILDGARWEMVCYKDDQDMVDTVSFELTFPKPIHKDRGKEAMQMAMRRYLHGQLAPQWTITEKENGSGQEDQS